MPRFVALLRGVNVGKAKRVPMAELRILLASLGYTSVATLLNSGNAVFDASKGTAARHAAAIGSAIFEQFKLDVSVIVKSVKELSAIVAENPIRADASAHSRCLIAFVQNARSLSGLEALRALVIPPERFVVGRAAAYLLCANGILESKAAAALLSQVGSGATTRNLATVLKLRALANESGR